MNPLKELQSDPRYYVHVLGRGIKILQVLSDGQPRSLSEISKDLGIKTSTTFRLLYTLSKYKFVQRDEPSGKFSLGIACLELTRSYRDSINLREVALPELEKLRNDTKETVHLAFIDNMEVVYVEKLAGLHAVGIMSSKVGGRAPAYCTGVGKTLLAYQEPTLVRDYYDNQRFIPFTSSTITNMEELMANLDTIRQVGYALDNGEHEDEVRCIAAPLFDCDGVVVAALSISGPSGRLDPLESNIIIIEKTCKAAQKISTLLGYPGKHSLTLTGSGVVRNVNK